MASCTTKFLGSLLFCALRVGAQLEGDAAASDELVADLVGQSLFGNVKSEDLVTLLNAKASFGSSADARLDELSSGAATTQDKFVARQSQEASSTSTNSPLLAASQKLKHLDAWATQKAEEAAKKRAAAAEAADRAKRLRALKAKVKAKAALPPPPPQLGSPLADIDENEDDSLEVGKIFEPAPLPNAADLVARMAAPIDRPDLLAPQPSHAQDITTKIVNVSQPFLNTNGARQATLPSHPKLKLRKPLVVPAASLGSSLEEALSDDGIATANNSTLELDLPAMPSPGAVAAATEAKKLFTEDLDSLPDLESLNTSSLMESRSHVSMMQPAPRGMPTSTSGTLPKLPIVAASLGPSLGAVASDDPGLLSVNETVEARAATGDLDSDSSTDSVDSFLNEASDISSKAALPQLARRSVNRAKADASVLSALDSEVQRGAAASVAEIDAAEAESEEGVSSIALPTVPLWGTPQTF
eukprot:gnl/MRDRNA2_/MRDRNA2_120669_c0_seq1.p1 gnl/MRDRNA2_/MRDRNA2_120669_c0~~gnl/MRDRNA2_/MRDRNA2_120669_c0_seq1.p1  ORF type:complete len:472 (+),score=125.33 gnl/MRDRNA2_/MRDRNA2_120669_c0_seq1:145-1560(+)